MLPALARTYLISALEGTPDVLARLLSDLASDHPRWDFTPDPERFTLREVISHLATVEPCWLDRVIRTRDENVPYILSAPLQDPEIEKNSPLVNLAIVRDCRLRLVDVVKGLEDSQWERQAVSESQGPITLEHEVVFALAHDGYHIKQIVEWLERA